MPILRPSFSKQSFGVETFMLLSICHPHKDVHIFNRKLKVHFRKIFGKFLVVTLFRLLKVSPGSDLRSYSGRLSSGSGVSFLLTHQMQQGAKEIEPDRNLSTAVCTAKEFFACSG